MVRTMCAREEEAMAIRCQLWQYDAMPYERVSVYECICSTCGVAWTSRKPDLPKRCPGCFTRKWDAVKGGDAPELPNVSAASSARNSLRFSVKPASARERGVLAGKPSDVEAVKDLTLDREFSQE